MLAMFWSRGLNSIQQLVEFTVNKRSGADLWFASLIDECRDGELSWDSYDFLHGYPTLACGSWIAKDDALACKSERCRELMESTWPAMRRAGQAWSIAQEMECDLCKTERRRRHRVLDDASEGLQDLDPRFAKAPYVHPYNWPKYQAAQQRAVLFAKQQRSQLMWVRAVDQPVTGDDKSMSGEALERQRRRWLQLHDMQTGGIMGLCPLTVDLPLRLTRTLDKERHAYKFSRCTLVGWELQDLDKERVVGCDDPEIVLERLPKKLFVRFPGSVDGQASELFTVTPRKVFWSRDAAGDARVARTGFPLVTDFSGTVHSYTGSTLPAAIADLLSLDAKPKREDMWKGYISLSRVKEADSLLIAQPFAPHALPAGAFARAHTAHAVPARQLARGRAASGLGAGGGESREAGHAHEARALALRALW